MVTVQEHWGELVKYLHLRHGRIDKMDGFGPNSRAGSKRALFNWERRGSKKIKHDAPEAVFFLFVFCVLTPLF
jgi:hypothetical protein